MYKNRSNWAWSQVRFCVASNLLLFPTHRKGNTEGVNGVDRPATTGEKYYWLSTKREKNYRLPTGKILTDYRYGPTTLSFFRKKSISILGSNQLYQRLNKFYWKDKGEKPKTSCFDERHKSFDKYTTKRGYWNCLQSEWKFLQSNPPIPTHYLREMLRLLLKENSFQFNGKVFLQTHGTAHDGHKLRQQQFPLPTGIY